MSHLTITGFFSRGLRRTLDDQGIGRFTIEHVIGMHCTAVRVPAHVQNLVVPIGQLHVYVRVLRDLQTVDPIGEMVTASLLIDGQSFLKLPDKFDFQFSGSILYLEEALNIGNVAVPWSPNVGTAIKKLDLQFHNDAGTLVGEVSMLLEVEVRR